MDKAYSLFVLNRIEERAMKFILAQPERHFLWKDIDTLRKEIESYEHITGRNGPNRENSKESSQNDS